MKRRDWIGLTVVVASLGLLVEYRAIYVEPLSWGALCANAAPPLACVPRGASLWAQYWYLWGGGGLLLGVLAFFGAPFAVAVSAVIVGIAGVVNYNASWGMLGAALGAWAWISRSKQAE